MPSPAPSRTVLDRIRRVPDAVHGFVDRNRESLVRAARTMVVAGLSVAAAVVVGVGWLWQTTDVGAASRLSESTVLLDRNGEELAVLSQDGNRLIVPLDRLPEHVADALIAIEDRRFFEHAGVDPSGVVRALWNNLSDTDTQGGSTLTQQLVKNRITGNERTLSRKAREAVLAVKLERDRTKDEILEEYLNTVYFGRGAYGIEAAARSWFGISAEALTVDQAALLVGLLHAPESYDAATGPDQLQDRRSVVLDAMAEVGSLTDAEASRLARRSLAVTDDGQDSIQLEVDAPHFVEMIRTELVEVYGEDAVYGDGLVVRTTLDLDHQRAAVAAVRAALDDPGDPQAALVGIDPSGGVTAWVGGRDFDELQVDLASGAGGTGRQPGSTFKPIALAAAIESGIGTGTVFPAPASVTLGVGDDAWTVGNASGRNAGSLTLLDATVGSVNTVYAQVATRVGAEPVRAMAKRLGVTAELAAERSIALGTEEVSPLDMAAAYSTFARRGVRIDPYVIQSVRRGDDMVFEHEATEVEVLDTDVADAVTAVLAEVPQRGTARAAALDRPSAAKTGTTQDNADAWLAGYTPDHTAVVWVGHPQSNDPIGSVDGRAVFGGTVPAAIWHDYMTAVHEGLPVSDFAPAPAELMRDTDPDVTIDLPAGAAVAGSRLVIGVAGVEVCVNAWQVAISGPVETRSAEDTTSREPDADTSPGDTVPQEPDPDADAERERRRPRASVEQRTVTGPIEQPDAATTVLDLPAGLVSGTYRLVVLCDRGAGGARLAQFEVEVDGVDPPLAPAPDDAETEPDGTTDGDPGDEDGKKADKADKGDDSTDRPDSTSSTSSPSTTTTTTTTTTSTTSPPRNRNEPADAG